MSLILDRRMIFRVPMPAITVVSSLATGASSYYDLRGQSDSLYETPCQEIQATVDRSPQAFCQIDPAHLFAAAQYVRKAFSDDDLVSGPSYSTADLSRLLDVVSRPTTVASVPTDFDPDDYPFA